MRIDKNKYLPVNNCAYWGKPAAWSQSQASFASISAKRISAYKVCHFRLFSFYEPNIRGKLLYYHLIQFIFLINIESGAFFFFYKAILFHPKFINHPLI